MRSGPAGTRLVSTRAPISAGERMVAQDSATHGEES
jgi:hypothetical protein